MANSKIKRTSAGLRDTLFDCIEKVQTGDMTPGDAQAIALLSSGICKTVQLEIEVAKLRTEYPADSPLMIPKPLQLGVPDDIAPEVPPVQPPVRRVSDAAQQQPANKGDHNVKRRTADA